MFEDIKKDDDKIVIGDPTTVEDVFRETDPPPQTQSAVKSGKLNPVSGPSGGEQAQGHASRITQGGVRPPQPLTHLSQLDEWSTKKSRKGMIVAIIILVIILAVVIVAAVVYISSPREAGVESVSQPEATANVNARPSQNENRNATPSLGSNENEVPSAALIDADGDGLTNIEEQSMGSDPDNVDTDNDGLDDRSELQVYKTNALAFDSDNDGLSDRDEIFIWRTDPNNPDSDDDTYLDGEEVRAGYSPSGPGKLEPEAL